jgi:uncharacterized membrane protein (UPF0127 family)
MIKNITKKTILVNNSKIIKSDLRKAIGLMFSRKLKDNALVFVFNYESLIPLHMFFVFYPIDVLFLDKNRKVVDIKENFKPFTLYTNKKQAKYVIELPKGTINKTRTSIGDKIQF